MVKDILRIFVFLFVSLFAFSCVTNKKLTYLQSSGIPVDTTLSVQPESYRIQPFDNLYIRVVTPDPQWSEMFNTISSSASSLSVSELSANLISYNVNAAGEIEVPYAGRFNVAGKTVEMVKLELDNALKGYINDAAVTIKLINSYISVLGEVQRPGRYPIYKDRLNIFQVLAMAGDMGEFSDRQKVLLIRQSSYGNVVKELTLNDRSVLTSDFFYIMPNDIIYAPPASGRFFRMNAFPYSVILSSITTFILILNFIK